MAWFIGQSAVMIVLAFLLGLLVGWIIWGRRARKLHIEVVALRAYVNACEANHGGNPFPTQAGTTVDEPGGDATPAAISADTTDAGATHDGAADDDATADSVAPIDAVAGDEAVVPARGKSPARKSRKGRQDSPAPIAADDGAAATDDHAVPEVVTPRAVDDAPEESVADGSGAKDAVLAAGSVGLVERPSAPVNGATPRISTVPVHVPEPRDGTGDGATGSDTTGGDAAAAAKSRPGKTRAARNAQAGGEMIDDLARIEGIGPKIAATLVAAGIRTYGALAGADEAALTAAIEAAGIHFAPSIYTWAEQARLLADGDEDGFAVLTARLIAGRRPDDDLERIEGIGPKMAAALHAAGIRTYRALADSDDVRLRNAIAGAGLTFAPSIVTWAEQARLLADGDEDGFADLTRRLVAGRDEGRA